LNVGLCEEMLRAPQRTREI
jgi:hypothetical protein